MGRECRNGNVWEGVCDRDVDEGVWGRDCGRGSVGDEVWEESWGGSVREGVWGRECGGGSVWGESVGEGVK